MRPNLKQIITTLAGVALFATAVVASPPAPPNDPPSYQSVRTSALLREIQREAAEMNPDTETLGTYSRNLHRNWEMHALYLERVKDHINAVSQRVAELHRIHDSVPRHQQQVIDQVTSHAAQIATSTQAAMVYLRENRNRLFVSEYREHLTTIAERSEDMKRTVDRFVEYERAQRKFDRLQYELEPVDDRS